MGVKLFYDPGSRTVLAELSGDIDHFTSKSLREPIDAEILARIPLRLILDLTGVSFMDSSGIGLIIGRYKLMNDLGGSITAVCPSPETAKLLELGGINRICRIVATARDASFIGGMKI
ncbi:MAG: anti-sigma factor antagonist [Ruminococcus sp.]|nr:anti-sigma factor antagonist [Ruminococcus sp.]